MLAWTLDRDEIAACAAEELVALRAAGVHAGDAVGWLGLNSPRPLALLQACRDLGARFVPLNTRLATAELAAIARDAGLQHLLHDDAMRSPAQAVVAQVGLPLPPAPGHEDGDVLLVYTSGTTGAPRGAVHTRDGMAANIAAAIDAQQFDAGSRALAVLPLFHVGGLAIQVLPTLAAGGQVRLHERFDPGAWLREVADWRPTTSLLVPAVMRALVEHPDWARSDLSSLAFVNSGSQIVPMDLIEAFHARGVPVAQVYGATETGPVSIVLRPVEAMSHPGRAGWPARGVQVRLADDGEILLQAPNLLRRYHGDGEPAFDAEGWFHTGDLARREADGCFEVVGRARELIISGGENIHPAEIENLLAGHPAIAEAAVVGVADARWGEVPVLVLVPRTGCRVDLALLQPLFDARLARYKHPRRVVVVDGLPKTALGKLKRAELARTLS